MPRLYQPCIYLLCILIPLIRVSQIVHLQTVILHSHIPLCSRHLMPLHLQSLNHACELSIGDATPLILMPPLDRSLSSMSWGLTEHPEGPRISMSTPQRAERSELSRSRESISASGWSTTGMIAKVQDGRWNTLAAPLLTHGWNMQLGDRLNQTFPKRPGSQKTITDTGSPGFSRITGISSMAAPQSKSSRAGTPAEKSVRFNDSLSSVQADIHSPAATTSNGHSTKL